MKRCKLCGEILVDDEKEIWQHLIFKHKQEIMKRIKTIWTTCDKCGRKFREKPEPIFTDKLKFVIPAFCKRCSGYTYGFIIRDVPPNKVKLLKG